MDGVVTPDQQGDYILNAALFLSKTEQGVARSLLREVHNLEKLIARGGMSQHMEQLAAIFVTQFYRTHPHLRDAQ